MNVTFATATKPVDRQILVSLYEQHSPELFRYAYRLLGDQLLAEDCVSETFSRFLQSVQKGKGPNDNPRAYLFRIAHNWVTDQYRRQPLPALELNEDRHVDPLGNPSREVEAAHERERIRAALLRLPEDQRRVIELRFLEDWSHEEVAEAVGKTAEATRALQHRGMAALRRMLIDGEKE